MSYHDRSRSPPVRAYSPSAPTYRSRSRSRSPPPPPRRYDERRDYSAPRGQGGRDYRDHDIYNDRVPPPRNRNYDDRVPPPRNRDYDERVPPPRNRDYNNDGIPPPRNRDYDDDRVPPPRNRDHPREREWDRAPRRDERHDVHRGGEMEYDDRRRGPSEPSRDLIFLGLDPELTEKELEGFLRIEHGYTVESSKIVRERATGQSKCFGFAQFATLEQAKGFMDDQ